MAQSYDKTNTSLLYSDYEPINLFEMCPGFAKQGEYIHYESATTPRSKFILPKKNISPSTAIRKICRKKNIKTHTST